LGKSEGAELARRGRGGEGPIASGELKRKR